MKTPRQFAVCVNKGAHEKRVPLLLNVQHDIVSLNTCLAVPVVHNSQRQVLEYADVRLTINEDEYVAVVSHLSVRPRKEFGAQVADVEADRQKIKDALDFLTDGF